MLGTNNAFLDDCKSLRAQCEALNLKIQAFLQEQPQTEVLRQTQERTRHGLSVIREALTKYDLTSLSLSYNGGKDCLVLLILFLASLASLPSVPAALESVYIMHPFPFDEVDSFVASTAYTYNLALMRLSYLDLREAFTEYLKAKPQVKAILVGTRRTDPHGAKLHDFDMTDGGWPQFMRVHPVLDWHYREIWAFLRHLEIPYCVLYDQGYTSLGGTKDTLPNPALKVEGHDFYRPAYELEEDEEERLGREKARTNSV